MIRGCRCHPPAILGTAGSTCLGTEGPPSSRQEDLEENPSTREDSGAGVDDNLPPPLRRGTYLVAHPLAMGSCVKAVVVLLDVVPQGA